MSQLAASHPHCVAAIVMVEPGPFAPPPDLRAGMEAIADAIEAGNQEPRREFIRNHLFLPTSDPMFVENVLRIMMEAPSHVAASALRGILAFDGPAVAAHCKVPALHLAAASPFNPPHLMSQWLPNVVHGQTVGAGHFNQLEAPDQVNLMIENFMRHYVFAPAQRPAMPKSAQRAPWRAARAQHRAGTVGACRRYCAAAERLAAPWRSDESPSSTCVCATRPLLHRSATGPRPISRAELVHLDVTSRSLPPDRGGRLRFSATNNSHPGGPR